jgi:hypothetical protein
VFTLFWAIPMLPFQGWGNLLVCFGGGVQVGDLGVDGVVAGVLMCVCFSYTQFYAVTPSFVWGCV